MGHLYRETSNAFVIIWRMKVFVLSKIRQDVSESEQDGIIVIAELAGWAAPQLVSFPFRVLSPVSSNLFTLSYKNERPRRHRAKNNEGLTIKIKRSSRYNLKVSNSIFLMLVWCYDRLIDVFTVIWCNRFINRYRCLMK